MPLPQLEVFETARGSDRDVVVTDRAAVEETRLAAWEEGYRAGWDDAVAAQTQSNEQNRAELERNLMTLSFTWQEARAHILGAIEPLLLEIVSRVLPVLSRETLGPVIVEHMLPLASEMTEQPARLILHPSARERVEAILAPLSALPVEITEDPAFDETQVCLRLGARETSIDLTRVTQTIIKAVQDYFTLSQENPDG